MKLTKSHINALVARVRSGDETARVILSRAGSSGARTRWGWPAPKPKPAPTPSQLLQQHISGRDYQHMMGGDDMAKSAMDLAAAKSAVAAVAKPKLIRRGLVEVGESVKFSRNGEMTSARGGISGSGAIYQPRGGMLGVFGRFKNPKNKTKYNELMSHIKNMSAEEKEMTNRIGLLHEGAELKAKKHIPFHGHFSPTVIVNENNIVNSLPGKYDNVRKLFTMMRAPYEGRDMGIEYGRERISRHYVNSLTKQSSISGRFTGFVKLLQKEFRPQQYQGRVRDAANRVSRIHLNDVRSSVAAGTYESEAKNILDRAKLREHRLDKFRMRAGANPFMATSPQPVGA